MSACSGQFRTPSGPRFAGVFGLVARCPGQIAAQAALNRLSPKNPDSVRRDKAAGACGESTKLRTYTDGSFRGAHPSLSPSPSGRGVAVLVEEGEHTLVEHVRELDVDEVPCFGDHDEPRAGDLRRHPLADGGNDERVGAAEDEQGGRRDVGQGGAAVVERAGLDRLDVGLPCAASSCSRRGAGSGYRSPAGR